jgi:hypothetical protein
MRWQLWHLVRSQSKKPQGPVTLLEVTHLACLHSLSRSQVGLRGPRALGHVFGKRFLAERHDYVVSRINFKQKRAAALTEWRQLLSA